MALAFITGPLQARLLGPSGRGELAAVVAVSGLAPFVFGLALNTFVAREIARRNKPEGEVFGSTAVLALGLGVLSWLVAWPIASFAANGRETVEVLILVSFALLPITLVGLTLMGAFWGRQQWRRIMVARLASQVALVLVFVVLAITDSFTVTTAAVCIFATGFIALAPVRKLLRHLRGWRFRMATVKDALHFGGRASIAVVAQQGNTRFDQVLMAGLVPAAQLGQYAVAVTFAGAASSLVTALNYVVLPMVARGGREEIKPMLRVTLWGMAVAAAVLALSAPIVVRLLFGHAFDESVQLVQILVAGSVLTAGNAVLMSAMAGDGRPGQAAMSEVLALAVTVPLLLIFLSRYGATAAALISVLAYLVSFSFLLGRARRYFGGSFADYVLLRRSDVRLVGKAVRHRLDGSPTAARVGRFAARFRRRGNGPGA